MTTSKAKPKKAASGMEVFKPYFPIGEAIVTLFHPYVEVALHDLRTGRIVKIWNCFSERRPGDASNLDHPERQFGAQQGILGPYEKALPSQGRSKSVTAGLRDAQGRLLGLLCINLDVSQLDKAMAMLSSFAPLATQRPEPIYRTDLQQHINYLVRDYSLQVSKPIRHLSRDQRMQLIAKVDQAGLFQARKSVDLLAKAMGISRASVYNLLNDAKRSANTNSRKRRSDSRRTDLWATVIDPEGA